MERRKSSRHAYQVKQEKIMSKVDREEAEGKVAKGSKQKIKKLFEKIDAMKWTREQARSILLGEQWFQGRTGVKVHGQESPIKEEKKETELEQKGPIDAAE